MPQASITYNIQLREPRRWGYYIGIDEKDGFKEFGVYFPQLCITAIVVPGNVIGDVGESFLDNRRIEDNIPTMLNETLKFVSKNSRLRTMINPQTGSRVDLEDWPLLAVREAVTNALVHRDYSLHTEG